MYVHTIAHNYVRFLLRKLLQYQSLSDTPTMTMSASLMKGGSEELSTAGKTKSKKKSGGIGVDKTARQTKEMLECR